MSAEQPFRVPTHERAMRAEVIDPHASVFLSANAGSGKTTILTNRVIRLLLEGVEPSRILCVTYTKAAAAEMQNRIFEQLASWVRLDDHALSKAITVLAGRAPALRDMQRARQLFAHAVETPGGLKLQTIHAFAERLLHLFPFEANVPARFSVMDDLVKGELLAGCRRDMMINALAQPSSPVGTAFRDLAADLGEKSLDDLISASLPLLSGGPLLEMDVAACRQTMKQILGLDAEDCRETVYAEMLALPFGPHCWPGVIDAIDAYAKSKTDPVIANTMRAALANGTPEALITALVGLIETQKGTIRDDVLTAPVVKKVPTIKEAIDLTKNSFPLLRNRQKAFDTIDRSLALMAVLDDVQTRFRAAKQARALVDFDDIIQRTLQLVKDEGAAWVMRKLDGGIDHVLLDEAQDTTPSMWAILTALTAEFFAGESARSRQRSVFAVGDEKQSIYSFQGAEPEAFARNRAHFLERAKAAQLPFLARELKLSFRTVADILDAVDRVFADPERRQGLSSDDVATVHETARAEAPGCVDLWPLEQQVKATPRDAWEEVDALGHHSAQVTLANRIAAHIRELIRTGHHESDGKPVQASDIMILVQRRDGFFDAMIRALKRAGVPVAGADRLRLTDEAAVQDLVAAAHAALLPEDDLGIANVLKSPLIGLDDDDLLRIAPGRRGSLFDALAASEDPRHQAAHATLSNWRQRARTETPYGFFATVLGPEGGRRKLLERLGPDAADGIDMYLQSVLAREMTGPPTLLGDVEAFKLLTTDSKRDQEQAGNVVRVMTIHGAKGLEARIVYLPDANRLPNVSKSPPLFRCSAPDAPERSVLLHAGRKSEWADVVSTMRRQGETARMEEYRRLYYVALTRARDRLVIAGWGDAEKLNPACWYAMAEAALGDAARAVHDPAADRMIRRFRTVDTPPAPPFTPAVATKAPPALPDWALRPAPDDPGVEPPLRPSRAIEAADRSGLNDRDVARLRGDILHALIERLPDIAPDLRRSAAARLLAERWPTLPAADTARLTGEALGLIEAPHLAALFGQGSQGEVEISGSVTLPDGTERRVAGRMDRLLVGPSRIWVADFKTGVPPAGGGVSASHAVQLAIYRALLHSLWPGREVEAVLVWTRTAHAEVMSSMVLDAALALLSSHRAP